MQHTRDRLSDECILFNFLRSFGFNRDGTAQDATELTLASLLGKRGNCLGKKRLGSRKTWRRFSYYRSDFAVFKTDIRNLGIAST